MWKRQQDLTISSSRSQWVGIEQSRSVSCLTNLPMLFGHYIFGLRKSTVTQNSQVAEFLLDAKSSLKTKECFWGSPTKAGSHFKAVLTFFNYFLDFQFSHSKTILHYLKRKLFLLSYNLFQVTISFFQFSLFFLLGLHIFCLNKNP